MPSVSNNGFIERKEDRRLGDLRKSSYTFFENGDIIIAKITPCMEKWQMCPCKEFNEWDCFG